MSDPLMDQALQNERIHYANCNRLITLCARMKASYSGTRISDLQAGQLVIDGQAVTKTLQSAVDFLDQPDLKPRYDPNYLAGLSQGVQAIRANTQIAAQVGTGGPNPWNVPFVDMLSETQNWANSFVNPYNLDGFPPLPTTVQPAVRALLKTRRLSASLAAAADATGTGSLKPPSVAELQDHLADHLGSLLKIRAYAVGVAQTNMIPITDPPPDWWSPLSTNLQTAKTHAAVWTVTLEPAMTATVPQAIINFGTKFQVAATSIQNILKDSKNKPSDDQVQEIQRHLDWLSRHLGDEKTTIHDLHDQFSTFQTNANADLTSLTTGTASIQHTIDIDKQEIVRLQGDILSLQADISADRAAITASGIAGGVGLFVGVGIMGFAAAAAGPAAPFLIAIGAFVTVGSIVEMASVISVYAKKLADAQVKLNDDNAHLTLEQQQVASLTLLNTSITNVVTLNTAMAQSLSEVASWWTTVETKLQVVIKDVSDAGKDATEKTWEDLGDDIAAAQLDWANLVTFATNMQNIATGASVQQVDVSDRRTVVAAVRPMRMQAAMA